MWCVKPFIYEINTWIWLNDLSRIHHQSVTLANVPQEALDDLGKLGVDAVWLMGIWQRSPAARQVGLTYKHEYLPVLPDLTDDDVIGSAYAIGAYEVDARLGGRDGLAIFRRELQARGLKLILDFVPNHVAADHPWVTTHPDYLVRANAYEFHHHNDLFFATNDAWGRTLYAAHGRDPYFPAWIDTAQVNAFSEAYRLGALQTLRDIATQCDGVRCDMAMLLLNSVFANTWGDYLEESLPPVEFWVEIIGALKTHNPYFLFIAEAYWGLEGTLLQQGFDFTYDKTLYDRIGEGSIAKLREHLSADLGYQKHTLRFIENHDEPRAATSFGIPKSEAGAALICTLPGAVLLHDGQFTGRTIKLPVQIRRQPDELPNKDLQAFYARLLSETRAPIYQDGEWQLLEVQPTPDDGATYTNVLAYDWHLKNANADERRLIIVNLTADWVRGAVKLSGWNELLDDDWCLYEVLNDTYYFRYGSKLHDEGLLVELKPFGAQIFRFECIDRHRLDTYRCEAGQIPRTDL